MVVWAWHMHAREGRAGSLVYTVNNGALGLKLYRVAAGQAKIQGGSMETHWSAYLEKQGALVQ